MPVPEILADSLKAYSEGAKNYYEVFTFTVAISLLVAVQQRPQPMKLLHGQVFGGGCWPGPGSAPLYQSTR